MARDEIGSALDHRFQNSFLKEQKMKLQDDQVQKIDTGKTVPGKSKSEKLIYIYILDLVTTR